MAWCWAASKSMVTKWGRLCHHGERDHFSESLRRSASSVGSYPNRPYQGKLKLRSWGCFPQTPSPVSAAAPESEPVLRKPRRARLSRCSPYPPIQGWGPSFRTPSLCWPREAGAGREAGSPPSGASCLLWEVLVRCGKYHRRRRPGCYEISLVRQDPKSDRSWQKKWG